MLGFRACFLRGRAHVQSGAAPLTDVLGVCKEASCFLLTSQVFKAVGRAIRALDKQLKKLRQQKVTYLQALGLPEEDWPSVGTARLAYEGVQAQMDVLKRLRELHVAELKAEVAQSELVGCLQPMHISAQLLKHTDPRPHLMHLRTPICTTMQTVKHNTLWRLSIWLGLHGSAG